MRTDIMIDGRQWLPREQQEQIDLAMYKQRYGVVRSVTGWTLIGSSYRRGMRIPGCTRLTLSHGGWLWFPEETALTDAIAAAKARGYDTAKVEQDLEQWVKTGEGARFTLE